MTVISAPFIPCTKTIATFIYSLFPSVCVFMIHQSNFAPQFHVLDDCIHDDFHYTSGMLHCSPVRPDLGHSAMIEWMLISPKCHRSETIDSVICPSKFAHHCICSDETSLSRSALVGPYWDSLR